MSKIQPLADRLVARPQEASQKTSSGIYLPSDAKEKPQMATVEAVGKDVKEIKKGDVVIHSSFGGDKVKVDGQEYIILKAEDVLAILN